VEVGAAVTDPDERTEPTLAATHAAAESARAANHAAYNTPRNDTGSVYDRTGALHALLSSTEQLARMLGEDVARLRDTDGLRSTDAVDPGGQALSAAADLATAAESISAAASYVNSAWSYLSPLYIGDAS